MVPGVPDLKIWYSKMFIDGVVVDLEKNPFNVSLILLLPLQKSTKVISLNIFEN
jgi:hypothetical protein